VHPNWPQVIYPLRVGLAERGWATLSIQMPILANDAETAAYVPLFAEVGPRLDAALTWLQQRSLKPIALVAHSMGSTMSTYHLSNTPDIPLAGYVTIGMGGNAKYAEMDVEQRLAAIGLPMLDMYGERDLQNVLDGAGARAAAASGNPRYSQQVIEDAGHFFDGRDDILVETIDKWLKNNL
jgi:pimeloyl-ACP methyl ester carboxylesterase